MDRQISRTSSYFSASYRVSVCSNWSFMSSRDCVCAFKVKVRLTKASRSNSIFLMKND